MKKVKFEKNGYLTQMTDKLAEIYKKKGKVKILSSVKDESDETKTSGTKKTADGVSGTGEGEGTKK